MSLMCPYPSMEELLSSRDGVMSSEVQEADAVATAAPARAP